MFSYYGTKKTLSKFYPKPLSDTIVEPFAGAAMYSLHGSNWKRNIILNDLNYNIYLSWKFLINSSEKDIKNLPDLKLGINIENLNISEEEKALLSFYANPCSNGAKKVTNWGARFWPKFKKILIHNSYRVSHWKVYNKNYYELDNIKATWFIDPPYMYGGEHYKNSSKDIDFYSLGNWCKQRKGEVIVCENSKADWLDFKELKKLRGQKHETTEVMYLQGFKVQIPGNQMNLFE